MQKQTNLRRAGKSLASLWTTAAFFGVLLCARAQTPPANDNVTNAQVIAGFSGTVTGNNQYATTQTGEPVPVATVSSGASIWYEWTAPMSNHMSFNTHGSTDPYGNTLDTVMAVYSFPSASLKSYTSPVIFADMKLVATNDNDPNPASWPLVSRVDFDALMGTTYLIQVEGKIKTGVTNEGYITLNWGPSVFAGYLEFTTNVFVFGQEDNAFLVSEDGTISPSLMNEYEGIVVTNVLPDGTSSTASTGEGRLTVTRVGGASGRIQVDLTLTNDWYTNTLTTNAWITNVTIETIGTNLTNYTQVTSAGYTNIIYRNTNTTFALQYDDLGVITTYYYSNYFARTVSHINNGYFTQNTTNDSTSCGSNAKFPDKTINTNNVFQTNYDSTGTNIVSYVVAITNSMMTNLPSITYGTPSALSGIDFYTNDFQTISMDDFQYSKDAFINILDYTASVSNAPVTILGSTTGGGILVEGTFGDYTEGGTESPGNGGPDWPDILGQKLVPGIPRRVVLRLVNPRLDPLESLDVAPPLIHPYTNTTTTTGSGTSSSTTGESSIVGEATNGVAIMNIEDFYNQPVSQNGQTPSPCKPPAIYNFERRTFRCYKPPFGTTNGSVTIYVYSANPGNDTLNYNIDWTGQGEPIQASEECGLEAGADNAIGLGGNANGTDYDVGGSTSGSVKFNPQSSSQAISIPLNNNGAVEFDMEFWVTLSGGGNISTCDVVIQFDNQTPQQQPGGAADRTWNVDAVLESSPPFNPLPGANQDVLAIAAQPDGKSVIGGQFTSYDATNFNYLVRTLANGLPDFSFNSAAGFIGPNDFVSAVAVQPDGKILIGGGFTSYNGAEAYHVARLNQDGSLDTSFNTGHGANGTVWALALDGNGNVIIGGDFTTYNYTNRVHIARLIGGNGNNGPPGTLDASFDPGTGTDNTVLTVAADSLNNVVIGGSFTVVNGTSWPGLARFKPTGALDTTFNPGTDVHGTVNSLAIQSPGNQIVIGGSFAQYNVTNVNNIARINFNGSVDNTFAPGVGVNGPVNVVAIQPADQKVLLGGQFTSVGGVRRIDYARMLPNGWVDTSFMDTSYNQFAGCINHYYNTAAYNTNDFPVPAFYNSPNYVNTLALQANSNVMIGGHFVRVGGGVTRDDVKIRWNVASVIGPATPGPQGVDGGIGNCPGNVGFAQQNYTANDTTPTTYINVTRVNGSLGPANVIMDTNLLAAGPGAAGPQDYGLTALNNVESFGYPDLVYIDGYGWRLGECTYGASDDRQTDGETLPFELTITDNKTAQQNLYGGISLPYIYALDSFQLGGENIPMYPAPANTQAMLEIINDNFPPGILGFSATNYSVVQNAGTVTITVLRTNGSTGSVSVGYKTQNGYTNDPGVLSAIAGRDYGSTTGTLTFKDQQLSASFTVPITNFSTLQSNKFFNVILYSPGGGAAFDTNNPPVLVTNAVVTIVDNHFQPGYLSLTSTGYNVTKSGAVTVGVQRTAGALGTVSVQLMTTDGTGSNGVNYTGVSTNLTWLDSDVSKKYVTIQTLEDNIVEGTKTFNVILTNAIVGNNGSGAPTNAPVLIFPTNAVVSIADDDSYGQLNFYPTNVNVLQNGGAAIVTVVRSGGTVGTVSVNYSTANPGSVTPPYQPAQVGTNYGATRGTLTFGPGVTSQTFTVPIYYTPAESTAASRIVALTLSSPSPSAIINGNAYPKTGTITIIDNQLVTGAPGSVDQTLLTGTGFNSTVNSLCMQPDGAILAGGVFNFVNSYLLNQVARLNPDGSVDATFLAGQAGTDGVVQTVLSQTPASTNSIDGPVLVAGTFAHINGIPRKNIARLNLNGTVDETFNPGSGADNTIYALVQTQLAAAYTNQPPAVAYIIGGAFANFNGVPCGGVARITSAGLVDPNFNIGSGVTGTNGTVHALAVQGDGKVIVGGDFTSFNNLYYHHLVRLNLDGSVDPGFNADTGVDITGSVHVIAIQPDGRILIGGVFTNVNGVNLNHIARLNADGSVDSSFNAGAGANGTVETIALDSQGRIFIGGEFTTASGVTRNGMTRLKSDGSVDPTINFGAGASGAVHAIAIQANDEINVGGSFASFGGVAQNNFTRLFGGEVSGPGTLNFAQAVFGVMENQTNAVITIQRSGGLGNASFPVVGATFSTADGTALNGVDYIGVTNTVSFPIGETFVTVPVPVINNGVVGSNKFFNVNLSNPIFAALGLQSSAQVNITNANTAVEFSASSYRQSENVVGSEAIIPVVRVGNPYSTLTVTVYTGTNGTAVPGSDYEATSNILVFYPGVMTNLFLVPLLNNINALDDRTVDLEMTNPIGGFLATPSEATLTIATAYAGPGVVSFSQPSYTVSEGVPTALITFIRTNGQTGPISFTFATSNGTATAGVNYKSVDQVVNFSDGQLSQTVGIPIIQQTNVTVDTTVYLILSNPVGTTLSGATIETLTIQNNIQNFTLGAADYFVNEGAGSLTISILRKGPTNGQVSVGYITVSPTNAYGTNGYAIPGFNYGPVTNGVVTFAPGQTFQTVPIQIFQQKTVDGPETFQVVLTNASAGTQISSPNSALVTIIGDISGFELATNAYYVGENSGYLVVTVNRLNVNTGTVSVNFGTVDGTALNGVDYIGTNGILTFADGQGTTNVFIQILDPNILENSKTFSVVLSNPSANTYVESPSSAQVVITNTVTVISFSSPTYTVSECGVQAQITVLRSGVTNQSVSIQFETADGTGHAGTNYFATNGVLTFAPGVTSTSFSVGVINNHVISANHTVVLSLFNPQGGAILASSTPAILTIDECNGSFIVAAGTLLTYQSDPSANGVIEPGETVTVDFALRCDAGGNTTNLVATLQTNSGVTPAQPNAQTYGALTQGGPVVFKPFTFTAHGSNSQIINASLQLQDGARSLSNVVFSFILGTTTTTFSNTAPISVPATNYVLADGPAGPYPASINVSGFVSTVVKATVTVSNINHTLPSDMIMVLSSPATNVLLMSDVGGDNGLGVTGFSVTFDDAAPAFLSSNQLPSGASATNKPTPYIEYSTGAGSSSTLFVGNNWGFLQVMPSPPVLANPSPPNSYATNLSVLGGTAANGVWKLYVADTKPEDSGAINNGWSLNLSTGNPVPAYADLELSVVQLTSPATASNVLIYSVALTNYGPATATGVILTNTLSSGVSYVSNSFAGAFVNNNGVLTFSNGVLSVGAGISFNVAVMPESAATVTNAFIAVCNQMEANTNNMTNVATVVSQPSADLAVTLNITPNPVTAGDMTTLTVVVTNNGPSLASVTTVTNYLPDGLVLTTNSATQGTVVSAGGVNLWNVGPVAANASATLILTAQATAAAGATVLDSVVVASLVYDPYKLNNFAEWKTVINPSPTLSIVWGARTNAFAWSGAATNFVLKGATNLTPPVVWVTVTNPAPILTNGEYWLPLPTNGLHFFILTTPH